MGQCTSGKSWICHYSVICSKVTDKATNDNVIMLSCYDDITGVACEWQTYIPVE